MSHVYDTKVVTLHLSEVLREMDSLASAQLSALLAEVTALQSALLARLLTLRDFEDTTHSKDDDRLLTVEEAAGRLGTSKDWLYRNAHKLPFTVHLGPRQLRFSSKGIEKYLRNKQR